MFRVRLAVVIAVSFYFVLFLGMTLHWGASRVALYFHRSQSAYEAFDHYQRLSQEAYRHFKQRMDRLITDNPAAEAGVETSKRRLYEAMEALRDGAVKETDAENPETGQTKPVELERVARFTAFLDASEYRFDEIERLRHQGKREEAVQLLSKFSEEEIDGKFQPLIDAAIAGERERARLAKEALGALVGRLRWIAILTSTLGGLFSIVALTLLVRGVTKPIAALLQGTDEIATGNLSYRIPLNTRDEFGYLAAHLNQMAQELDVQQQKLREGRAVLEKKVAERTRDLHQLNGELQRMDAARREFLADISHELRTPITVIRGEAEVTLRGHDRDIEEYKDALQRIVELAMQLNKYVADLLFLARTENTNLQFEDDNLDLSELVSNAVDDIQVMAQENSIAVVLDAPNTPIWVRGDKQRLRQVLFILGDNACRYASPNTRIAVKLQADGNEAQFIISDQGIGIPTQDLELVFDRYYRSQNARHSRDDGTGLGLPMARSILKAHGGRISVASTEGVGTTFTVTLPLGSAGT
ncbi:MAG: ATP-binding protein [Candidatus Methylumidiphilus sp.]